MSKAKNERVQVINGITVLGTKAKRKLAYASSGRETSAVNFSGPEGGNVGKLAVFLLCSEVFGRIFNPEDGEIVNLFHSGEILHEDANAFVVGNIGEKRGRFVMKYAELYSFFRIVETQQEVDAIESMVEAYAARLFNLLDEKWPFDVDMLEELEDASEYGYFSSVPVEVQEDTLRKLKQTDFKSFSQQ